MALNKQQKQTNAISGFLAYLDVIKPVYYNSEYHHSYFWGFFHFLLKSLVLPVDVYDLQDLHGLLIDTLPHLLFSIYGMIKIKLEEYLCCENRLPHETADIYP